MLCAGAALCGGLLAQFHVAGVMVRKGNAVTVAPAMRDEGFEVSYSNPNNSVRTVRTSSGPK
jgi:hypothetical protein